MVRPQILQGHEFTGTRKKVADFVEHRYFVRFIVTLIVLNAITIGFETDKNIMHSYGPYFLLFDYIVIKIFLIEVGLKLFAYRKDFFRVGWNVFDLLIVLITMVPHGGHFSIFRSLRIFRLFRLFSLVPQMRNVIGALFHAIPGMASIIGILLVIMYISSVICVQLFGQNPDPMMQELFGNLSNAMYTMFQLLTLEGWPGIANPTIAIYPWAWMFFIPFIIVTTFAVLNLFIGIIVDALNIVKEHDETERSRSIEEEIDEIKSLLYDLKSEIRSIGK